MKNLIFSLVFLLLSTAVFSQSPPQLNFQGAARDAKGNVLINKNISIRLSIVNSATSRVADYSETRFVKTNAVGLFNIVIGSSGASYTLGTVGGVDWSSGTKYLWIEMDPLGGSNFIDLGITQFQSVPYALNVTGVVGIKNGGTGATTAARAKTNLGLDNVDNTSDLNKPVGTAAQTALNTKLNLSDTSSMLQPYATLLGSAAGLNLKVNIADTADMLSPYAQKASTTASLNSKVNISDTASMLSPYATLAGQTSGLNSKVNISDTAVMLSPYAQKASTTAGLNSKVNISDTASMLSPYATVAGQTSGLNLKVNIADTSAMLSSYAQQAATTAGLNSKVNISDTASMLSPYATAAGQTSGLNLKVNIADTSAMLSPYAQQAATTAGLNSKVNISDTASMLSPYATAAGQTTGLNLKVNIADTAAMLSPYAPQVATTTSLNSKVNISDTAAMLSHYATISNLNLKVNISDTASMLSPYATVAGQTTGLNLKVNIADTAAMLSPYAPQVATTTSLNTKVNISDTAAMLSPYATVAGQTTGLNLKVNIADTAAMLSPYAKEAATTAGLNSKVNISDTASMLSPYATASNLNLKVNISDTAAMLSPYAKQSATTTGLNTKVNISDTAAMLSPYATASNLNLKVNIADTASMLSPYATLAGQTSGLNTKVNISDTAAMLSPYATTSNLNLKVNIADTAAMLSPYAKQSATTTGLNTKVNISDTAAMLSPYATASNLNLKVNIADTSAMLSPYATLAGQTSGLNTKVNISDTAAMLSHYATTSNLNLKVNIADTSSMLSAYARTTRMIDSLALVQNRLDLKAPVASPTFTGTVTLPTATVAITQTAGNNSTAVATTAYADAAATSSASGKQNTLTNSAGLAGALSDETGTGLAVFSTSPTLVTPTLGVAAATSINKLTITAPATSATLTIANTKSLTVNNSLTLAGTDASTLNIGGGGTLGINAYTSTAFAPLASPTFTGTVTLPTGAVGITQTAGNNSTALATTAYADAAVTSSASGKQNTLTNSADLAGALNDETGTGVAVFSTSPTLVTPTLGAATATSLNKLTITAPVTSATLTIANTKSLTVNNSLTLAGTDASTLNIGAGGTLGTNAYTSTAFAPLASPTFTGTVTLPTGSVGITQTAGNNSTALATTAYADAAATSSASGKQNTLTNSAGLAGALSDETGTGLVVFATSPTLVTPTLGVAAATSINKLTLTAPATSATLTIADTKSLTVSNSLTLAGTDASTLNIGAGGTLGTNAFTSTAFAPLASPTFTGTVTLPTGAVGITQSAGDNTTKLATTAYADAAVTSSASGKQNTLTNSAGLAGALSDETGTGLAVFATSPTLVTPTLGVAAATSINKLTITAPATSATLTIANTKSLTVNNSLTLAGTDASTLNIGGGGTLGTNAYTSTAFAPLASPTFTGTVTLPTGAVGITQTAANNSTALATTAYADAAATSSATGKQNTLTNSAGLAGALSDETGTGLAVFATSPTLVTPVLGVATATSINGLTPTALATGFTIAGGTTSKTLTVPSDANVSGTNTGDQTATTVSNTPAGTISSTTVQAALNEIDGDVVLKANLASPTFTGTVTLPTGTVGVTQAAGDNTTKLATTAYADAAATASAGGKQSTLTNSAGLAGALSDETGTGLAVFATSPTLVTPTLGAATATSLNKLTITAPATSATLTIANTKSLTVNNSLTLAGTDASTLNIGAGGTLGTNAYTSTAFAPLASPTFTGTVTLPTGAVGITQTAGNNSTALATTAYADAAATASVAGKQGTLTNSAGLAGALSDETGTGLAVFATSPTLVTPTLGVAAATSINKLTLTAPATSATLTIADTKSLTVSNSLTLAGTDASTLNIGAGGTLGTNAFTSTAFAPLASPTFTGTVTLPTGAVGITQSAGDNTTKLATTAYADAAATASVAGKQGTLTNSAGLAGALSDETGTGLAVFATSPTLVTPTLGVAAATSINKLTITAPATSATLTIANTKSLTVNNSLTLAGTDASTLNIGGGGTLGTNAYTSTAFAPLASPTFTGTVTLPTGSVGITQTAGNNSTALATTAFVTAAITPVREVADEFTATASQVSFTLTQTKSANSMVKMYVNGVRISNTAYSVSGTTLTYTPANNGAYALAVGDRIQMDYYY